MKLNPNALSALADLACTAAHRAGEYIQQSSKKEISVLHKASGDSLASQVVTEVDGAAQDIILDTLSDSLTTYDLALLTEESPDDGSRQQKDYFWCIDPLDGTLPFTRGIPGYGVSIALVQKDGTPIIGVIFDPVSQRLYRVVKDQGILVNGTPWKRPQETPDTVHFCFDCSFANDPNRSDTTEAMETLARKIGYSSAKIHIGGGAVLNACYVLEHPPAIYYKRPKPQPGGGSLWDFAATACLFAEAGAHASDFFGHPLALNSRESTFMNSRGICYTTDPQLRKVLSTTE